MKKFLAVLMAVCLVVSMGTTSFAFSDSDIATPESGKKLGEIINQMSPYEQLEAGLMTPNLKWIDSNGYLCTSEQFCRWVLRIICTKILWGSIWCH